MIHHGTESYEVAVSNAAKHFQQKIEDMIHVSVPRVAKVIEQVQNDVPTDAVVYGKKLQFLSSDNGIRLLMPQLDTEPQAIHDHAFRQIAERTNLKNASPFLRDLSNQGAWGREQVANILTARYGNGNGSKYLLRSVRGEVRGFLSDQFRRLDSRPLLDAFVSSIRKFGARPVDGFALQTKMNVRAILPMVFEPYPGEIMAFGAQLSDSDFGDGKLTVSGFILRLICTNLATTEDVLSQVHLGRRLSDSVQFSAQTLELDTAAMASAVNDVCGHVLGSKAVNNYLSLVKTANESKIEPAQIASWVKKNLTKAESEKSVEKFASADVELLPAGQSKWRWSNCLSWLANETEDEHRKLELQEFAGTILK